MVKAKKIEVPKVRVVVMCGKCERLSNSFMADETDIVDDKLVSGSHGYGYCNCGHNYNGNRVLRNPDSPEVRVILLERQVKDLMAERATMKTTIDAYEKAMALLGGGGNGAFPFVMRRF